MPADRLAPRLLHAGLWTATAGLAAAGAVRFLRAERHPVGIAIQGVSAWLSVPAGVVAAASVAQRRPVLVAVAVPLFAAFLRHTLATFGRGCPRPPPLGATSIRLISANVLERNPSMVDYVDDLMAADGDVLLLQEVTPENLREAAKAGLLDAYPEYIVDPQPGFNGSAIVSRLPIAASSRMDVGGCPMTQADIVTAAGPLRVVNVHPVAPVSRGRIALWHRQLDILAGVAPSPGGALVLAGDFNATLDHKGMAALLDHGLRDAFVEAGAGLGATWPRWPGPLPALMRLDHVLVSDRITVTAVTLGRGPGSDHRRVVTDLALSPH